MIILELINILPFHLKNSTMKQIIILLVLSLHISAQESKVYETSEIHFYGYDYQHFKLIDPKNIGKEEDVKQALPQSIGYAGTYHSAKYYHRILDWNVIINYQPTLNHIKNINPANILAHSVAPLNGDSIDSWINKYELPDKTGIGYIVFIDYIYKKTNTTSMWFVFFDLETRRVLLKQNHTSNKADGNDLRSYFGEGIISNENYYLIDRFRKVQRAYQNTAR